MHSMSDALWLQFFEGCADVLKVTEAGHRPREGGSWCAWTTFDALGDTLNYWKGPLPTRDELRDTYLGHGANWSQYFHYSQLCHFIVPLQFYWERKEAGIFENGWDVQNIAALSERLEIQGVPHRLTPVILEIKCY